MQEDGTNQRPIAVGDPRLLRFMVNGKSCYALKWRDEKTENRREVNYVLREAASNEIRCLLVDGPLRIAGFPELVSVQSTGRTLARAGSVWELALTVWADGTADDEGMIRICPPETFQGRGQYLRDDLKRMIREYRMGTRECHAPTSHAPASVVPATGDTGRIEQRLADLTAIMQKASMRKDVTGAPLTARTLRDEMKPVVDAVEKMGKQVAQEMEEMAPNIAADRHKAQVAWIRKVEGCSANERKATLLRTEGYSLAEIAKRLPHKKGKPLSREGVRCILRRFERKTKNPDLHVKGTYRQNVKIEAEAKEAETTNES